MSDRLIPVLSFGACALLAVYLLLVVTTVVFAAWQTQLADEVREVEARISTLEATYYDAIARMHTVDPAAVGFVSPESIAYVTAAPLPAVSFAN